MCAVAHPEIGAEPEDDEDAEIKETDLLSVFQDTTEALDNAVIHGHQPMNDADIAARTKTVGTARAMLGLYTEVLIPCGRCGSPNAAVTRFRTFKCGHCKAENVIKVQLVGEVAKG